MSKSLPSRSFLFIIGDAHGQNAAPDKGWMQVKRPAYGADGPVIDHPEAAQSLTNSSRKSASLKSRHVAAELSAFDFCDSLESTRKTGRRTCSRSSKKRRGYDLTPLLPALIGNVGPKTAEIRSELAHDLHRAVQR